MANGVVFLPSYHEAIKDLPDSDRLQMYDSIVRYGLYGEIIEMSPLTKSLFTLIKPNIDSSQNRYRAAVENGKTGGRPRKNQTENQKENQKTNQKQNQDKDIDKDSDSDNDKEFDSEGMQGGIDDFISKHLSSSSTEEMMLRMGGYGK